MSTIAPPWDEPASRTIEVRGRAYRFEMTCPGCPEQYDVFDEGGQQVGYFRLRHHQLTVEHPDCGGQMLIHQRDVPDSYGDFGSAWLRQDWMETAAERIDEAVTGGGGPEEPTGLGTTIEYRVAADGHEVMIPTSDPQAVAMYRVTVEATTAHGWTLQSRTVTEWKDIEP